VTAFAYVANSFSSDVSVIQTTDDIVTATVPIGAGFLQSVAITPNGAFVYVTHGGLGATSVAVIRTSDNTVLTTVPGDSPYGVPFASNGAVAYVANTGSNHVSVIRTSDHTVTTRIPVGVQPIGIAVTPNGVFVYVTKLPGHRVRHPDVGQHGDGHRNRWE
jgi:YVTN family beta-propeller protein